MPASLVIEIYNTSQPTFIHQSIKAPTPSQAKPHAAQTSCPFASIQLPSELTLESQSCNLKRILSICFMSNTLGCTQLMRAMPSTWSMLPLNNPKLNAFIIRCSISSRSDLGLLGNGAEGHSAVVGRSPEYGFGEGRQVDLSVSGRRGVRRGVGWR